MNSVNPWYYVALFGTLLIGLYALYCDLRNTAQNGDDSRANATDADIQALTTVYWVLTFCRKPNCSREEWFTSEEEAREQYDSSRPLSRAMYLYRVSWPAGGNDLRTFCRHLAGYTEAGMTSELLCDYKRDTAQKGDDA